MADDSTFVGATSDDSDIVTLESPPVEDLQTIQEATEDAEAENINDDELNLGSSSSSQYTFAPPETGKNRLFKVQLECKVMIFLVNKLNLH